MQAGHLIEVGPMVKMAGSKFYYIQQAGGMAGAVQGDNLKLADPADASKFLQESPGEQEDMRAQDYNAVAIEEGREPRLSMFQLQLRA